ncbi:phosphonopyruvate decarboxylase [Treponema brennaborense]|uniref:Phosphonopyruvate decarboxylase n=1 Tax=Treponema brennaborense (strain DSM 12168 / CIP 105900 / DD5/3) TaxID=906968 RepID=F4LMG5_TREBD|nr:phosphonopyruvate decarboxylase [Treponema brennaborense]AEE15727.1 phosphonopyruvate decarboxylase [Treponema brennaborense DSM 12168]
MIKPELFYNMLIRNGTDFFTGVPDSLLKSFCAYLTDNTPDSKHIIAANEGCAAAIASGYHFATGKIPLVYMQNSGIGNAVNPLLSLADPDVYSVPLILVIGWRGEPGVHDEPQHVKQGKVTCDLFDAMKIPYTILSPDTDENKLEADFTSAYDYIGTQSAPYAFVVRKDSFEEYKLKNNTAVNAEMKREEAIERIMLSASERTVFVSTTGMASRELYELREKHHFDHSRDFLTVGSMGHASQIALSLAMQAEPRRPVYCIDGDGASIMQMGGMATIGTRNPANLCHFVLNNGAHDSVGGQPTVGLQIKLSDIARSCGYKKTYDIATAKELDTALAEIEEKQRNGKEELTFVEIKVCKGARKDLGRPKSTPQQNKTVFMEFLKK